MRVAFSAFLLLLCASTVSLAQTPGDPVAVVRGLYRGYESHHTPARLEKQPLSPRMRKLLAADAVYANGEVGRLDFDPIINAQDWKITDLSVTLVLQAQDKAEVEAKFTNIDAQMDLRYDLIRSNGRWLIDDIRSLTVMRWTLSKILEGAPDAYPDNPAK